MTTPAMGEPSGSGSPTTSDLPAWGPGRAFDPTHCDQDWLRRYRANLSALSETERIRGQREAVEAVLAWLDAPTPVEQVGGDA